MKKSIYFHIDEYNRDTIVASSLYKKLSKYFNLYFGNRIDQFNLRNHDDFDIYIFPTLEILENAFEIPNNCKGSVYILPNESISGSLKVKRRLQLHLTGTISDLNLKKKWIKKVSKFFLWGNSHFKVLHNYSKEVSKKCLIVGHPRHDKSCYGIQKKTKKEFTVGFVSRFDLLNIFDDRLNFESIYNAWLDKFNFNYAFSKKSNVEHQWFNAVLDYRNFLDIIKILNQKKIIPNIRPHPRENVNNWQKFKKNKNLKFNISRFNETFVDWINKQDLIITSASTSLYDCALLNKNVIVIDKLSPDREKHGNLYLDDFDPIIKYFYRPKSLKDLQKRIYKKNIIKKNKTLSKLLFSEVNYPNHINSLQKISEYLIEKEYSETEFNLIRFFKQKVFILKQNYFALKLNIKKLIGFKEVGSIFSLGYLRQKNIKNYKL